MSHLHELHMMHACQNACTEASNVSLLCWALGITPHGCLLSWLSDDKLYTSIAHYVQACKLASSAEVTSGSSVYMCISRHRDAAYTCMLSVYRFQLTTTSVREHCALQLVLISATAEKHRRGRCGVGVEGRERGKWIEARALFISLYAVQCSQVNANLAAVRRPWLILLPYDTMRLLHLPA